MRIGLFGGTFNPVHMGHLILAQDALEEFELDEVLFIPASIPPHKTTSEVVLAEHRLAMLDASLEGDPRFSISTVELDRGGVSYSVDTVRILAEQYPGAEIFFIIGGDTLFELYTWKDVYALLGSCTFIIMARPEMLKKSINPETTRLQDPWPERLGRRVWIGHQVGISSSDIRMRVAEGLSIRYLVTPETEMYIGEHHLYQG